MNACSAAHWELNICTRGETGYFTYKEVRKSLTVVNASHFRVRGL